MIRVRLQFCSGALALAIASCAQPVPGSPVVVTGPDAQNPEPVKPPKKKPMMNGRGKVSSISLADAFALQQSGKALIYDARPGFFYSLSRIPSAISLPKPGASAQVAAREAEIKTALAEGKTIVVYCSNFACPDARAVAIHLASYGYSSSTLTGGWEAWKESGLPTE
ncbi:MAG: rhodanese-like domain-containing protein [Akkermansiaceae bacterium]